MSIYHAIDWMQGQVVGGVREYYDNVERVQKGLNWLGVPTDLYGIGRATGFNDWLGLDRPKSRDYSFTNNMPSTRRRRNQAFHVSRKRQRSRTRKTSIGRKRKTIKRRKVSKDLKKTVKGIIKKVMDCKENVGTYNKHYTGEIEPYVNAGQHRISYSMTRSGSNAAPHSVFDMQFMMTREKILDAVSVLYNGKAKSSNWSSGIGNFGTKGLKIDLLYSSLELGFTNYTEWCYEVAIYECTAKFNSETPVLEELSKALLQDEWVTPYPVFSAGTTTAFDIEASLELGMVKVAKSKYDIKKVKSGKLYPGHTIKYFGKWGPKCIDFEKEKVLIEGLSLTPSYAKGDVQVLLRYTPVMHVHTSVSTMTATNLANTTNYQYGFIVEGKETYKFYQPAEADEANGGDKRALYTDIPFEPVGGAPYTQRYTHTGPSFINITNPRN